MQSKEVQGKLWSTAPEDWTTLLEPTFIPLYQSVLDQLDLDDSTTLLDAGCGSGLFLTLAKARGAIVHGIDAAHGLLDISRKRLPGVTLLIEDLESLPFMDGTFDVVTGFNSFQYAGDRSNALKEAARVLSTNGKLVVAIWGREENCETGKVLDAVSRLLPEPPAGTPGPFALSEEGTLNSITESLGLKIVKTGTVVCPWFFPDQDSLLRAFLSTGPCIKASLVVGEETVRETILKSAESIMLADNLYFMRNEFNYFVIEKA